MASNSVKRKSLLESYFASIMDLAGRERYLHKISVLGGADPYEILTPKWMDDVDTWLSITHIRVEMYLLCTPVLVLIPMKNCSTIRVWTLI